MSCGKVPQPFAGAKRRREVDNRFPVKGSIAASRGHPTFPPPCRRLSRILGIAVGIAIVVWNVSCSRKEAPHLGEWEGHLYFKDLRNPTKAYFFFEPDGRVKYILTPSPNTPGILEGMYRCEYDRVPPHLHIDFRDGTSLNGLLHYFGREKTIMHFDVDTDPAPGRHPDTTMYYFLVKTKSERKEGGAPE